MTSTYVKIAPDVSIRRWVHSGGGIYRKNEYRAYPLPQEYYDFLQDLFLAREVNKEDELVQNLLREGIVVECEQDDKSSEWSGPHLIPNLHFRTVTWAITGKCNYRCKHCFVYTGDTCSSDEWTLEEGLALIDQIAEAGLCEFNMFGGEPLLHPHLLDFIQAIYDKGMSIDGIDTNGAFLTEKFLDELDAIVKDKNKPTFRISFDGLGKHDWLRGTEGAEEAAIQAIKLAVSHGYTVMAEYCVHRGNVENIKETVDYLEKLGVSTVRIIKIGNSVRWEQNKGEEELTYKEFYDHMLSFTKEFVQEEHTIDVGIWNLLDLHPTMKAYTLRLENDEKQPDEKHYACGDVRMGFMIGANGSLWPCQSVSGIFEANGFDMGNVKEKPLWELLYESPLTKYACLKALEIAHDIPGCATCEFWNKCRGGGCTAAMLAVKLAGEGQEEGVEAGCLYYKEGYDEKFKYVLQKWHQLG